MPSAIAKMRRWVDAEALIWALGLAALAAVDPASDFRFTLFWPEWVFGIESPGRGLGRSIGYLFRGDVQSSVQSHWLGAPVAAALTWRAASLQIRKIRNMGENANG